MRYFITLICSVMISISLFAQIGMDQWKLHVSPNTTVDLVIADNIIYTILEKGLLEYDMHTSETTLWTITDYLSDVSPSAIGYNHATKSLLIGYHNGNMDLLVNETVYNLPFILQSNMSGVKKINRIVMHDKFAYIATGLGVVVLDIVKKEIKDTYHPTLDPIEFLDIAFIDGKIYVLTHKDIFEANINNQFLADPSQWTRLNDIPDYSTYGGYSDIETFNGKIFVGFDYEGWEMDTLYQLVNNQLIVFESGINLVNLNGTDNFLMLSYLNAAVRVNKDFQLYGALFEYPQGELVTPANAYFVNDNYYVADLHFGLVKSAGNNSKLEIGFSGPRYNSTFRLDWNADRLSVATGGHSGIGPTYSLDGGSFYENYEWSSITIKDNATFDDYDTWDFLSTAVNQNNSQEVAFGTISPSGIVVTNGNSLDKVYDLTNSGLEEYFNTGWIYVSDLVYDDIGNLWVANSNTNYPLKVLTPEGNWYKYSLGSAIQQQETKRIVIDHNNVKWLTTKNNGLYAFSDGNTISDAGDDQYKHFNTGAYSGALPSNTVEAIAVDIDNNIWIGTPEGMRVLYNTEGIFDAGSGEYNFQKLLIEYGENVEIVLGTTHITAIRVDGGNRKWVGTESSGIFLLSPDGLDIERHFTSENSPLISNTIYDIAIDHTTGEVFFATPEGLISYRSDASQGDIEYKNVQVFPNPVLPDYHGPITIQGIAYNSDVKITDVSGKLVYQTKSNGGTATWSGKTIDGERASTGVYLIWTSIDDPDFKGRKVGKVVFIN
ncbi:MAG: two-component regulator propeller domain-containing protein [Brumimicrobium sp.]